MFLLKKQKGSMTRWRSAFWVHHQHWKWHNWSDFHFFPTNDSLKYIPWTIYNTNLQEFTCSYWGNERYCSEGVILASECTQPPSLSPTELKRFSVVSQRWNLETHPLWYIRLDSATVNMFLLTKRTIMFRRCHSGFWASPTANTEYDTSDPISTHFPRTIAENTSPKIITSRIRKS